ncbi:MAG: succinate dehydrogenase, hydrophobic membrane anchor protein [Geminicoccaceae bacterium]|nr:succinate dehydrogenase, hydrophobic membrane anchor protein [Geminicoccaceae bacterium]
MALQTAIGKARGLGSAREGTGHFKMQRLTGMANVVLVLWFVFAAASLGSTDYVTVRAWLSSPVAATLMILLVISTFYHARLGLQVVVEDYVHHEGAKIGALAAIQLLTFGLGIASVVSVLMVAIGS